MAQVSIGKVENLEELVCGLLSMREALESSCREQIIVAERKCDETREEAKSSENMLEDAIRQEQAAKQEVDSALPIHHFRPASRNRMMRMAQAPIAPVRNHLLPRPKTLLSRLKVCWSRQKQDSS